MVPSGNATTVWPARSRSATAPTTLGQAPQAGAVDRDDLHQAGQDAQRGPVDQVGPGDERAGHHRTDREDVHPGHVAADHQHTAQVANRPARHRDSHAEAAQHQPAVAALDVRATRQRHGQQRQRRHQQQRTGWRARASAARRPRRRPDAALAGPHAAGVARRPRQPGVLDRHDAIPSAIAAAAATDRSRLQVAGVGPALVQQRREVADPEVRVVGGFAAYLRAEPQVAAHQRRHGHPGRRVDVVEALAVDRHRPVRAHGVLRRARRGGAARSRARRGSGCRALRPRTPCTGTDTQPVT